MKKGFTLTEILVVLVIMGFLVAMVSPKLGGIVDFSEEPIDSASQNELLKVLHGFVIQKERLPRGLVNLVSENNATSNYEMLSIDNVDGGELSSDINKSMLLTLHHLNSDEAAELKSIGVSKVRNYKQIHFGGGVENNHEIPIDVGVAVLMAGGGATDSTSNIAWATSPSTIIDNGSGNPTKNSAVIALDSTDANNYAKMDGGFYAGRILLGIDNANELVDRGVLNIAGSSPKAKRDKSVAFQNYILILPRLKATTARMGKTTLVLKRYDKDVDSFIGEEIIKMSNSNSQKELKSIDIASPYGETIKGLEITYGVKIK